MKRLQHQLSTRCKQYALVVIAIFAVGFEADLASVVGYSVIQPDIQHKVDAVVVLGAKVGTPALKYRTLTGLSYYQQGKTDTLVLSGAQGREEPVTEAAAMLSVIQDEIAKTHSAMPHIILETRSTNTFENIGNAKQLIPNAKSVVIVSDGYHLARSVAIAKHAKFEQVYWDSPRPSYYATLDLAHYYVREAVALVVYAPQLL